MGNIPTIRWNLKEKDENNNLTFLLQFIRNYLTNSEDDKILGIVNLAAQETLRNTYNKRHLTDIYRNSARNSDNSLLPWFRAPEVLTCVQLIKNDQTSKVSTLMYPDPPLGVEELNLLEKTVKHVHFITPTQFKGVEDIKDGKRKLKRVIGVSISDSPDLPMNGLSEHHLKDVMVEFVRFFLACGATIAYGGDLRKGGFTKLLFDLTRKYTKIEEQSNIRIISYLSWPFYRMLSEKDKADLNLVANIKKIELPEDVSHFSDEEFNKNNINHHYAISRALTEMREKMNDEIDCRLIIGGRIKGFLGKYPGLIEEAYLAMQSKKPVYLIGAFGGITRVIIKAILGKKPEELTIKYQRQDGKYKAFIEHFNRQIPSLQEQKVEEIDYELLLSFFESAGIKELNNGLMEEENLRLFETVSIFEMVSLVMKGIANTNSNKTI